MNSIDQRAIVEVESVPEGVAIGPFAVVHEGVALGRNVLIGSHAIVASGASLGDDVVVEDGAYIGSDVVVESGVVVGAGACVGGSPRTGSARAVTRLRLGATVGAGTIVATGMEVGEGAVVRDGSVLSRSVPRDAVVAGSPAAITGYVGLDQRTVMEPVRQFTTESDAPGVTQTSVRGVQVHRLPLVRDLRGSLIAAELEALLPFTPRRYFLVFDVPTAEVRGEHAHYACHQFLVCITGRVHVIADDGAHRQEFVLEDNRTGLYLPPLVWGIQYRYSADCTLMVLASHPYDASDYIRDYETFLDARQVGSSA